MSELSNTNLPVDLEEERARTLASIRADALSPRESEDLAGRVQDERYWQVEHLKLDLANRLEKKERRAKWDKVLTTLVIVGFVLSYVMIFLIGVGLLKFPENSFAVPSVVAAGIVETYGLAKLAVKYFFSEDGSSKKRKRE